MAVPATPSSPDASAPAPTPSPEQKLQGFWKNYQVPIAVLCVAIIIGIAGRGLWVKMQQSKEASIEADFAAASTPESLKTFAAAHEGHALAGAAYVRIADKAYTDAQYAEAITNYQSAIADLPAGPVLSRVKLGLAMSEVQGGREAEGVAALKTYLADTSIPSVLRAQAAYQLASLAASEGRASEASGYCDQVLALDQVGQRWWGEQAFNLKASLGTVPAPGSIKIGK